MVDNDGLSLASNLLGDLRSQSTQKFEGAPSPKVKTTANPQGIPRSTVINKG